MKYIELLLRIILLCKKQIQIYDVSFEIFVIVVELGQIINKLTKRGSNEVIKEMKHFLTLNCSKNNID